MVIDNLSVAKRAIDVSMQTLCYENNLENRHGYLALKTLRPQVPTVTSCVHNNDFADYIQGGSGLKYSSHDNPGDASDDF